MRLANMPGTVRTWATKPRTWREWGRLLLNVPFFAFMVGLTYLLLEAASQGPWMVAIPVGSGVVATLPLRFLRTHPFFRRPYWLTLRLELLVYGLSLAFFLATFILYYAAAWLVAFSDRHPISYWVGVPLALLGGCAMAMAVAGPGFFEYTPTGCPTRELVKILQQEAKDRHWKKPRSLADLTATYIRLARGGIYLALPEEWDQGFHEHAVAVANKQGWAIDR